MMSFAVCDDTPQDRERICCAVSSAFPGCEVRAYADGISLLEDLDAGFQPLIAVLDIQMETIDGIALAKELRQRLPMCRIVFITDYLEYAPDVYDVPHSYFVLKSQLEQRIKAALNRARDELFKLPQLSFRFKGQMHLIKAEQVLYLERRNRKTYLYCAKEIYETSDHGRDILNRSGAEQICQCHKSYWVNLQYVAAMERDCFLLENKTQIPISRSFAKSARTQFFAFLRRELI